MAKEGYKKCKGGWRKLPTADITHLHFQCSVLTKLAILMRKWPINSDFTAHSSSTTSKRILMGQASIEPPLERTDGGLRCKEMGYIRKGTPQKIGMNIFQEKRNKWENKEIPYKRISSLLINIKSILGLAWGSFLPLNFWSIHSYLSPWFY